VRPRLAESEARIHDDTIPRDSRRDGNFGTLSEERRDLAYDVAIRRRLLHRPRLAEHVHQHDRRAALAGER
jgi:hypothetical protein